MLSINDRASQRDWAPGSAALAGTRTRAITSRITGRTYQISVALPYRYAEKTAAYPVLFGVDANAQFGTVVETARYLAAVEEIPELIIVGIGYPDGSLWSQTFGPVRLKSAVLRQPVSG